jgi:hypothetical protein
VTKSSAPKSLPLSLSLSHTRTHPYFLFEVRGDFRRSSSAQSLLNSNHTYFDEHKRCFYLNRTVLFFFFFGFSFSEIFRERHRERGTERKRVWVGLPVMGALPSVSCNTRYLSSSANFIFLICDSCLYVRVYMHVYLS